MKYSYKFFYAIFIGLLFICGVGRDDVKLSKYYQFAKEPVFDCIGELYYKNEFQLSCVLIDKKHILTAAHAFYYDSGSYHIDSVFEPSFGRFVYGDIAEKQIIGDIKDFYVKFSGKKYAFSKIKIHEIYKNAKPYRDENGIHPSEDFNYDIAMVELEKEVSNIAPAILYEGENELHKRAIMSGYGEVERANEVNADKTLHKRKKMAGENMIDSLGGFKIKDQWAGLYIDFDAPNSKCCNRMGSSTALPLEYYTSAGDCGSGLFIYEEERWKLAGMHSAFEDRSEYALFGDKYGKYYGFTCYYLRLCLFKDWINRLKENML